MREHESVAPGLNHCAGKIQKELIFGSRTGTHGIKNVYELHISVRRSNSVSD
jgi:hypothetical protein